MKGFIAALAVVLASGGALAQGVTDNEILLGQSAALSGPDVDTPFGRVTFRALDHQSTMGAYVGKTAVRDGKGVMVDWRYADGKDYLPADDVVRKLRPAK